VKLRLIAGLLLAAAATACGRGETKTLVAFVPKAMDSEFWLSVAEGAKKAAAARPDVQLSIVAPDREVNIDQQVSILEDQIRKGAKALVVAPAGSAQVVPVLEQAAARGIPVILVDSDAPFPKKVTYVGTDNKQGGRLAAQFLAKHLAGQGEVALIHGVPGNLSQDDRAAGFAEALAETPGLQLVARQPANSERALGLTVMENVLTARPNVKGVFCTNDQMALGALEALAARGLTGKVAVVGFDATDEAVRAVADGRLAATIAQNPRAMGEKGVEAALAVIAGKPVEPRIDTGTELVTSTNAAPYLK
jgi:ribose transport system substrate-binding protein